MELEQLKEMLEQGQVPQPLILYGEEQGIINLYIDKIQEILQLEIERKDSVSEVMQLSNKCGLLGSTPKLYIVRYDLDFVKEEKLWEELGNLEGSYLIIVYEAIDKRSRFYKNLKDNITQVDKVNPKVLKKYILKEINVDDKWAEWLINATNGSYSKIILELEKLKLFEEVDYNNLMDNFIADGGIHSEIPDCVFEFIDAVLYRNVKKSFKLYEQLRQRGESNIKILSLLYTNFRNLASVQLSEVATPNTTGLTQFQINIIRNKCGRYSDQEIIKNLKLLSDLDKGVKQGEIEEVLTVPYFLVGAL